MDYTCNKCSGQAKWHCGTCDDFDLCDACYKLVQHEHKMEPIKSIIGDSGAESSTSNRFESIQVWGRGGNDGENEELIAITKELADTLRKNKTIDWQRKESARAKMRTLIKRLLKKHKYPPEGMDDAVQTVMTQCELWTDNNDMSDNVVSIQEHKAYIYESKATYRMAAEETAPYGINKDR